MNRNFRKKSIRSLQILYVCIRREQSTLADTTHRIRAWDSHTKHYHEVLRTVKPLPIDMASGTVVKHSASDSYQPYEWAKRNREFRRRLVNIRRHMANELLFGTAAVKMLNKVSIGNNQKKLQQVLVKNLYALKLAKFKKERMDLELKASDDQLNVTQSDSDNDNESDTDSF